MIQKNNYGSMLVDKYRNIIDSLLDEEINIYRIFSCFPFMSTKGIRSVLNKVIIDFSNESASISEEQFVSEIITAFKTQFSKLLEPFILNPQLFKLIKKDLLTPYAKYLWNVNSSLSNDKKIVNGTSNINANNVNQFILLDYINKYLELEYTFVLNHYYDILKIFNLVFSSDILSGRIFSYFNKKEIIDEIINKIIYRSASEKITITNYSNFGFFVINGVIVPSKVIHSFFNDFPEELKKSIMVNDLCLSGDNVTFFDVDSKLKFKIPTKSLHSLGLENNPKKLFQFFQNKKESLHLDINDSIYELKLVNISDYNLVFFCKNNDPLGKLLMDIDKSFVNMDSDLTNETAILSNIVSQMLKAQNIISNRITSNDLNNKAELLVYLYLKKYGDLGTVTYINSFLLKSYYLNIFNSLISDNTPFFGAEFLLNFNTNIDIIINMFRKIIANDNERSLIEQKYDFLFLAQKKLSYFRLDFTRMLLKKFSNYEDYKSFLDLTFEDIFLLDSESENFNEKYEFENLQIVNITINENKITFDILFNNIDNISNVCSVAIFDGKLGITNKNDNMYDVELVSESEIKMRDINDNSKEYFVQLDTNKLKISCKINALSYINMSLGYLYIKDNFDQLVQSINNSQKRLECVNLFKVDDKIQYICNYNYTTDVINAFSVDMQNLNSFNNYKPCFIFEMLTRGEDLMVVSEDLSKNGETIFVSVQNAEEVTMVNSDVSIIPEIDFGNNHYKTIIGLARGKKNGTSVKVSNILSQTHSDFQNAHYSLDKFIALLNFEASEFVELRYATSGNVSNTLKLNAEEIINNFNEPTSNSIINLIEQNAIGCSNVMVWLESVDVEEFKQFSGISSPVYEISNKFDYIRSKLFLKIIKNLETLLKFLLEKKNSNNLTAHESTKVESLLKNYSKYLNVQIISNTSLDLNNSLSDYLERILSSDFDLYNFISSLSNIEFLRLLNIVTFDIPSYVKNVLLTKIKNVLFSETNLSLKEKILPVEKISEDFFELSDNLSRYSNEERFILMQRIRTLIMLLENSQFTFAFSFNNNSKLSELRYNSQIIDYGIAKANLFFEYLNNQMMISNELDITKMLVDSPDIISEDSELLNIANEYVQYYEKLLMFYVERLNYYGYYLDKKSTILDSNNRKEVAKIEDELEIINSYLVVLTTYLNDSDNVSVDLLKNLPATLFAFLCNLIRLKRINNPNSIIEFNDSIDGEIFELIRNKLNKLPIDTDVMKIVNYRHTSIMKANDYSYSSDFFPHKLYLAKVDADCEKKLDKILTKYTNIVSSILKEYYPIDSLKYDSVLEFYKKRFRSIIYDIYNSNIVTYGNPDFSVDFDTIVTYNNIFG